MLEVLFMLFLITIGLSFFVLLVAWVSEKLAELLDRVLKHTRKKG